MVTPGPSGHMWSGEVTSGPSGHMWSGVVHQLTSKCLSHQIDTHAHMDIASTRPVGEVTETKGKRYKRKAIYFWTNFGNC